MYRYANRDDCSADLGVVKVLTKPRHGKFTPLRKTRPYSCERHSERCLRADGGGWGFATVGRTPGGLSGRVPSRMGPVTAVCHRPGDTIALLPRCPMLAPA